MEHLMASELPGQYRDDSDTWTGLSRLAAQAVQILEVSDKIASGGDDTHSDDEASLRESMQDELGGLRAAIDYVIGQNGLDWNAVNRQRDRKRALYERREDPEKESPSSTTTRTGSRSCSAAAKSSAHGLSSAQRG
jgi:hypothetical protein